MPTSQALTAPCPCRKGSVHCGPYQKALTVKSWTPSFTKPTARQWSSCQTKQGLQGAVMEAQSMSTSTLYLHRGDTALHAKLTLKHIFITPYSIWQCVLMAHGARLNPNTSCNGRPLQVRYSVLQLPRNSLKPFLVSSSLRQKAALTTSKEYQKI